MYEARVALLDMPTSETLIHLFWLSGPFILLVERTPADIWLSLLALAFVVRGSPYPNIDMISAKISDETTVTPI